MKKAYLFLFGLFCFIGFYSYAQPINDSCAKADVIIIPNAGFGLGTFVSTKVPLDFASREAGESFDPLLLNAGMGRKSVWYKFSIATARTVTVQLRQRDTMIAQNAAGFAVYYSGVTKPLPNIGMLSKRLPTISKFGSSAAACLQPGDYLIQVCARLNVTDTIWLELDVAASQVSLYDNKVNAYDFGVMKDNKDLTFNVGCLSIEGSEEFFPLLGSRMNDYTQTAWFVLKTDNFVEHLAFRMYMTGSFTFADSTFWAYRIYKGDARSGSLTLLDSSLYFINQSWGSLADFIRKPCQVEANTYYSIQFIFNKKDEYPVLLRLFETGEQAGKAAYPPMLPSAYRYGVLANGVTKTSNDYLACNTKTSLNQCGTNVPALLMDSVLRRSYNYLTKKYDTIYDKDTFDLNSWVTFEVPQSGRIKFDFTTTFCGYGSSPRIIRLFSGDVTVDCNLPFVKQVKDYMTMCIEPGKYSVQIIEKSYTSTNSDCYYNAAGASLKVSVQLTYTPQQPAATNDKPAIADDLGDITALMNSGATKNTVYYSVGNTPDSFVIAGQKMSDRVLFTQFHISQSMQLGVDILTKSGTAKMDTFYLLKGRATTDSLTKIPNEYGTFWKLWSGRFTSSCLELDTGWYTMIAQKKLSECDINVYSVGYKLNKLNYGSQPRYNRPYKAYVFNNGNPMEWTANTGTPTYPKTRNIYQTPLHYFGCSVDTPFIIQPNCVSPYPWQPFNPVYVNYYVVKIKNNGTMLKFRTNLEEKYSYPYGEYSVFPYQMLFKTDVRLDSMALLDSSKMITTCVGRNTYCNLDSGTYTLMLFGQYYDFRVIYAVVDKMYPSVSDYAINANDIGYVPYDNVERKSSPDFFSCATGAFVTDPVGAYQGQNNVLPSGQANYVHQDQNVGKNLWYTFTAAGTGTITINSYPYSYPNAYRHHRINIYKSDEPSGMPFAQLKTLSRVDSTIGPLTWIGASDYNQPFTESFVKDGCDTVRYYVIITDYPPFKENYQVEIGVKFAGIGFPLGGDLCSNAIAFGLSTPSTATASAIVNCHSLGEGFGEDGSNMGCLGNPSGMKTTWFKFTYSGTQKIDLTFELQNNTSVSGTQIKYRILYGSCNSMTPGPCVGSGLSSFKLDCMAPGDYYIQVSTPLQATGNITLKAVATNTVYPVCKPFDLSMPFAYFYPSGGCSSSQITFTNLSSQGKNIKYKWDFGNGVGSTDKTPVITFQQKYATDTFQVKLLVTDTILNKKDSTTIPVYVFYNSIWVDAGKDTAVTCSQIYIGLKATTNYATPVFEWTPANLLDNAFKANPNVLIAGNGFFKVKMIAENCTLVDSMKMSVSALDQIKGDSVMKCDGGPILLVAPPGYTSYYWSTGQYGSAINIYQTGSYSVRLQKGGCIAYDTILVTGNNPVSVTLGKDTSLCSGELVSLSVPYKNVIWSTGATDSLITVNQSGNYWVKVTSGPCVVFDTVTITKNNLQVELGTDTSFCAGDSVILKPQISGIAQNYLWSTGSGDSMLLVKASDLYKLKVKQGRCEDNDSVQVTVKLLPVVSLPADTTFCGDFVLILKPDKTFDQYLWSTGATGSSVSVKDSGVYWLRGVINNCSATDSIFIAKKSRSMANIGEDTSFCGDFILKIDAGEGKSYLWFPSGEQSREVYVHNFQSYSLTKIDTNGCVVSDTISISEVCEPTIFVPNAFTPNANGLNEYFKATVTDMVELKMYIFDRWGELLFYTNDVNKGWDGTYNGKPVQQDVYSWIIYSKGKTKGSRRTLYGTVNLLR